MKAQVISMHFLRRRARKKEREWQRKLEMATNAGMIEHELIELGLPRWIRGVKVVSAGRFQHAVVATDNRGH